MSAPSCRRSSFGAREKPGPKLTGSRLPGIASIVLPDHLAAVARDVGFERLRLQCLVEESDRAIGKEGVEALREDAADCGW